MKFKKIIITMFALTAFTAFSMEPRNLAFASKNYKIANLIRDFKARKLNNQ